MIIYDYEYDLLNQPFFSRVLDEDNSIVVKFVIPQDTRSISGFSIKLNKAGNPGNIYYNLRKNNKNLINGEISAESITPVFETFIEVKFPTLLVDCTETFLLELKADKGKMPLEGYRIFGPRQDKTGGFDAAETIPYWWSEEYCYGMNVPKEYGQAKYEKSCLISTINMDGSEGPGVCFGITTENEANDDVEQRFEFVRKLVAPPYAEWKLINAVKTYDNDNCIDVLIDSSWGIRLDSTIKETVLLKNISKEFKIFFERIFGYSINGSERFITFNLSDEEVPQGNESHLIRADVNGINISARHERGFLRAIHYMEDIMLEKHNPRIMKGVHLRKCMHEVRMTNGLYPAPLNYYALQSPEIWTEGYIWRLARAGYNSVWISINLEEIVVNSRIFPELNDPGAPVVIERLKRITRKAKEFGVDVYFEIKTGYFKWFSEKVFERHPEIKSFPKWGNYPCTGNETFEKFLEETLGNTLCVVPELKGIIIIYDTEGFYSCFTNERQSKCPICKDYSADDLALRFLTTLKKMINKYTDNGELIAWTYYCDSDWNYRLMKKLPPDVRVLSCYSQFVEFERFGISNKTDDYACCVTGPSEYFEKVYDISRQQGTGVIAKTEVSFGQEFVGIPYIPCLTQHQKRWDSMNERTLYGFMGDYIHRGFIPSPCTDLMRINAFYTEINGRQWLNSNEKLQWTASLNFGEGVAEDVTKAWELFSRAMNEYFPYSPEVCRYPGPLQAAPGQPFYLDKKRKIKRNRARYNAVDLSWAKKGFSMNESDGWNVELVLKCFVSFNVLYKQGVECLENALSKCKGDSGSLTAMINIAKMQVYMVESMINFINFISLRDRIESSNHTDIFNEIKAVCLKELGNAQLALHLCEIDSNLGFSCEGQGTVRGGYFTPATIKEKIFELEATIQEVNIALSSKQ